MNVKQLFVRTLCLFFIYLERYLVISISYKNSVFYRKSDKRLSYASLERESKSAIDCVASCASEAGCLYVNYNFASAQCEFSDKGPNSATITLDVASGWNVYVKEGCETGWYDFNGSCYFLVQERSDWDTAKEACESLGAHLIDIQTEDEHNFITDVISSDFSVGLYWIGASDIDQEGVFTWSDGSPLSLSFSAWGVGQPDNARTNEDCVHMMNLRHWNDKDCSDSSLWRICEKMNP